MQKAKMVGRAFSLFVCGVRIHLVNSAIVRRYRKNIPFSDPKTLWLAERLEALCERFKELEGGMPGFLLAGDIWNPNT